jgi:predicted transcriptional regulator
LKTVGELESEVLYIVMSKKAATISEITSTMRTKREIAYTTVSNTLSRLHKKSLIERNVISGPRGTKYVYSPGKDEDVKRKIVDASLERLVRAFGQEIYETMYVKLLTLELMIPKCDNMAPQDLGQSSLDQLYPS